MKKLMSLDLFWKSKDNQTFRLGTLKYENGLYSFNIYISELRNAIINGCYGIGNFDLKRIEYTDKKLFDFFANRLPPQSEINNLVKIYNIDKENKMKILELTKGKKFKDNYWLENTNLKIEKGIDCSND